MTAKKHILCISGGKDSMATAILAIENREPLDAAIYSEVMFDKDISGEVPEHRDFIHEKMIPYLESNGIPVFVVRGGEPSLTAFTRKYREVRTRTKTENYGAFLMDMVAM